LFFPREDQKEKSLEKKKYSKDDDDEVRRSCVF